MDEFAVAVFALYWRRFVYLFLLQKIGEACEVLIHRDVTEMPRLQRGPLCSVD